MCLHGFRRVLWTERQPFGKMPREEKHLQQDRDANLCQYTHLFFLHVSQDFKCLCDLRDLALQPAQEEAVNSEPWRRVCSLTHANARERNAHTGRYLSFFWDRLSSMYLYFWYCSSSFVRTASAVSLPGCFIKDSTSSCKKCDQGVSVCFNSQHVIKRKTKQTKQKSVVDDLCCESNIKNYRC